MATATLAPGLARKVKKCLQLNLESEELTQALHTISDIYPENNAHNRRRLKATVEQNLVAVNTDFLHGARLFVQVRAQPKPDNKLFNYFVNYL
jgi:conserved oligomeric Golgi complex subunit 6